MIVAVARDRRPGPVATTTSTTADCAALPYQPCGASGPAPGTDGRACLAGFEDYDEDPDNGCEAADDGLADDAAFPEGADPIQGTIVPRDDVDTFAMQVGDGYQLLCDGRFTVTITAPAGHDAAPRGARRRRGDRRRPPAPTASPPASPSTTPTASSPTPRTLTARVSPIGTDRTGGDYTLERSGSY